MVIYVIMEISAFCVLQRVKVSDKVVSYITLFHSGRGYYLGNIRISYKYPHSGDIIRILRKYQCSMDIIYILWIYLHSVDIISISWIYSRSVDIIRISCIYLDFLDTICIQFILSALATLKDT